MAAHSFLRIGSHLMYPQRESLSSDIAALFTESEVFRGEDRYSYVSNVAAMRDRLQLQGFTHDRARAELELRVARWHSKDPVEKLYEPLVPMIGSEGILANLRSFVNDPNEWATQGHVPPPLDSLDARTLFRLALDQVDDPTTEASYELHDLTSASLLDPTAAHTDIARADRQQSLALDAPLVVLVEGSTDSQLLTAALTVTHPHLVGFLRFMDFSGGAEGSAASLVKLVRSFAGAGIANRVVAIADNDAAAWDALAKLKTEHNLPDGYRLLHYPELALLRNYPTLGPQLQSQVLMDVNGTAGSLEMYFGEDVLRQGGELRPVQWTGYIEGQAEYQGSLSKTDKSIAHAAFRQKIQTALNNPAARGTQDWTGIESIFSAILQAFD